MMRAQCDGSWFHSISTGIDNTNTPAKHQSNANANNLLAADYASAGCAAMGAVIAEDFNTAFYSTTSDCESPNNRRRGNCEDSILNQQLLLERCEQSTNKHTLGNNQRQHCSDTIRIGDAMHRGTMGGGESNVTSECETNEIETTQTEGGDEGIVVEGVPHLDSLASDVTPVNEDENSNDEQMVLSLPSIEGWLSKVGTYVKFYVPVFVRCRHGVLTVSYDADEKPKQRLVLQGAKLEISTDEHTIHIQTSHGKCDLQCEDTNEHSLWYDAIKRSVEWEFSRLYEQGRDLAYGASARVYVAKRRRTGGLLAMKSVDKLNTTSSRHEVNILADSQHPNVMRALDILETDEHLHIAQPLMALGSLRDELNRHGGLLDENYSRRIMFGVLSGLTYIHNLGVVHRDLKPDNVFLHDHQVKVGDFGLSCYAEDLANRPPAMCGTPHFAAPEMVRGEHVDEAVDVWAAGVMLFELLTGKLPFTGDTFEGLFAKIKLAQFDVKALMYRGTSLAARTLVMQMLTPAKDKRISVRGALDHEWFDVLRQ